MKVEQIYTGCLAQGAYYIVSNGEAAIIDPLREVDPYIERAEKDGVEIKYIFETHFHADFVSGHVTLSEKTGAPIIYGPTAAPSFDAIVAEDGQEFPLGNVKFKVLHTPGHTMESSTYLLLDEAGKEHAIFSGDTLFLGDVGRPDLAQKAADMTQEELAGMLYDSLREKIMTLPDETIVYPGHGAGSACGKNMMEETVDTLGNQKKMNYALRADMTKEEFVEEVTEGLLPPPGYFAQNVAMNKTGYESIDEVLSHGNVPLSVEEFKQVVEHNDVLILDTRSKDEFVKGFVPGSIFIGLDGNFAPWVGALIPDLKQEILFIAPEGREEEVVTRLARVGYDNTLGYLKGGIDAWRAAGEDVDSIESIHPTEFGHRVNADLDGEVLDVRKPTEYLSQRVEGAKNFPLDYINKNMGKVDRKKKYYMYCKSGYRSLITASILKSRGFNKIVDLAEGFQGIMERADVPKTEYVCPTEINQEVLDQALAEVV